LKNRSSFDKVTESLKVGTFLRHSVERYCTSTYGSYKLSKNSPVILPHPVYK